MGERPQQGSDDDSDAGEETKPAKKRKAPGSAASKLPPGVPPPPKKPSSAFQIYCRKLREAGQGVEKGLGPGSLGEATAIYGEKWRSLDDDDKQVSSRGFRGRLLKLKPDNVSLNQVYQDIYEEEKRVYERELGEYIQKYGIDPTGGKRPAAKKPKAEKYISSDDDDNPKKRKKNKSTPAKSGVVPQPSIVPSAPVLSSRDPIAQSAPQTPAGGEMDDLIDFGDEDDSEDDMTEEDSRNQDYNDMDVSLTYSPIGAGRAMLEDEEDELGDT